MASVNREPSTANPFRAGDLLTIEPSELVAGGEALARIDGFPIFGANIYPGDVAMVRLTEVKKGFARGELVRIESASPLRRAEPCPVAEELRQAFALDRTAKIKTLSKGQKARAGLLIALAHRPELLVLDEPSSGLDPIVRRDILGAVIRTIADEGRTVLFSSHLLEEVEQVADHVTMISEGTIVLSAPLNEIKESHRVDGRLPSLDEIFVARVGKA